MTDDDNPRVEAIDTSRSSPRTYLLNDKDRKYCKTGEKQSKMGKSELKKRLREDRIQGIPQRFQDLFDDLALIDYSDTDILSRSEKRELWENILEVETRGAAIHGYSTRTVGSPTDRMQFGLELGAMVRYLDQHTDFNETNPELVWGFILGLHNLPKEMQQKEKDVIDRLFSTLNDKRSKRVEFISTRNEQRDFTRDNYQEFYQLIKDVLKECDIEIDQIPPHINWERELDIGFLTHEKEKIKQSIENNVNINKFQKLIELKQTVEEDINQIENQEWRTQDADEIIRDLWRESKVNPGTTRKVDDLNTSEHNDLVRKLINDYSSSADDDRLPTHYQIIDENNDMCKLTEYGKLVSYCLFDNHKDCEWIQTHNIFYEYNNKKAKYSNMTKKERRLIKNSTAEIGLDIDSN